MRISVSNKPFKLTFLKKPSYSTNDPKGWCGDPKRGAALGRPSVHEAGNDYSGKLYLQRIDLDSGGYDKNGTYFGHGSPLWWYASADGTIDAMLRAHNRDAAKEYVRVRYPKAKFFR